MKAATRNFDPANKIGEGGFGSVYKVNVVFPHACAFVRSFEISQIKQQIYMV